MNSDDIDGGTGRDDEDLASFMPDFSLMGLDQRSPNDDEQSVALASTTGRFNNDIALAASGAPTKTCMPGGFFWRSKVRHCLWCVCLFLAVVYVVVEKK